MGDRAHLSIGEVLSLLRDEFPDITISKIRFLESQGLLDPERTPSGYRKFYEEDVERLRWILRQQREHFLPLKVIKGRLSEAEPDEAAAGVAGWGPEDEASGRASQMVGAGRVAEAASEAGGADRASEAGGADRASEAGGADRASEAGGADRASEAGGADRASEAGGADRASEAGGADRASEAGGLAGQASEAGLAARASAADKMGEAGESGPVAAPDAAGAVSTRAPGTESRAERREPAAAGPGAAAPEAGSQAGRRPAAGPASLFTGQPDDPAAPTGHSGPAPGSAAGRAPRQGGPSRAASVEPTLQAAAPSVAGVGTTGGRASSTATPPGPPTGRSRGQGRPSEAAAGAGPAPTAGGAPMLPGRSPLADGEGESNMTLEELAASCGLSVEHVRLLEQFGLLSGRDVGGTSYYGAEAQAVAVLAAGFANHGVEARHLRMYKNSAERESGLFEQIVMPLIRQRNPKSRQQAAATLEELARLGAELRDAMLRQALRDAF